MQDKNEVSECVTGQFSINNWKHKYGTPELERALKTVKWVSGCPYIRFHSKMDL
jgi:hypothetical protein